MKHFFAIIQLWILTIPVFSQNYMSANHFNYTDKNFIENFIAVDHVYVSLYKDIKMYDFLPHLFWSPWNSGDTDIQNNKLLNYSHQIDDSQKESKENKEKNNDESMETKDESKETKDESKETKIAFIAFWHDFNYMDNVYTKTFLQKYEKKNSAGKSN